MLGHKDFAVHEALELLTFTQDVTIYTNGKQLDVSGKYIDELGRFRVDTRKILKLEGDEFLEQLHFADGSSENIDGLFVAYESASSVDFARKLGILTVGNTVVTDNNQRTNLEGVFAAGDCSSKFRQISVAVGQGAVAGKAIIDYIKACNVRFNWHWEALSRQNAELILLITCVNINLLLKEIDR